MYVALVLKADRFGHCDGELFGICGRVQLCQRELANLNHVAARDSILHRHCPGAVKQVLQLAL